MTSPAAGGADRADYLAELATLLWPPPTRATLTRAGLTGDTRAGRSRYAVVPSAARPRLLVPLAASRAAASAVRHATEATGPRARLRQRLLGTAFRTGLGALTFRDRLTVEAVPDRPAAEPLDAHLSRLLDQPVLVSIHIGPARANRKPVLQLLRPDGVVLGYAKLGVDPLTRKLVDAEADALRRLAAHPLPGLVLPEPLHHGRWREHALLVQSALPVGLPRARSAAAITAEQAAMRTVSGCLGTRRVSFAASDYGRQLAERMAAIGDRPETPELLSFLDAVRRADPMLAFGAWHGDWNGGNSAVLADGRVLIWDWERFAGDVPVGYDALHRRLQTAITRDGVEPQAAARTLLDAAGPVLVPFGQAGRSTDLVAVLYLVELATRYLADRQAEAGARLGQVRTWLLPAVAGHLAGRAPGAADFDGQMRKGLANDRG